jgi:hypothetical protein
MSTSRTHASRDDLDLVLPGPRTHLPPSTVGSRDQYTWQCGCVATGESSARLDVSLCRTRDALFTGVGDAK